MNITKGKIGNALTSTAADHIVAVANDIYDEAKSKYQSELNSEFGAAKINTEKNTTAIEAEKARAQAAEDKLRDGTTVRFDGIVSEVTPINPPQEGEFSGAVEIIYYEPGGRFVYRSDGELYEVGDSLPTHMAGSTIRTDKIYLLGSTPYVWNNGNLTPAMGSGGSSPDSSLVLQVSQNTAAISRNKTSIDSEVTRAKDVEAVLRAGTTVRFDGVEKTTQNILPAHEGEFATSAQIIFYQPLKVFVYKVDGKYYHVGDTLPNHMVNGVIRKDKAYLLNGDIYVFDGTTLTPTTAAIAEELSALRRQVNNIQPVEYSGNVTNAPDEEDLTSDVGNKLRLKDRMPFNGMGYVILRKEKTLAEQLTQDNTIYEIRYDFDLDGEEVTIPENCVLKFEGGSIMNGAVTSDGTTSIKAGEECVFDNLSQIQVKRYKTSWGKNINLSNIDAPYLEVDNTLTLDYKWQLHPNQKVSLLSDIDIIDMGQISLNIGCEIDGRWHDIIIKDKEAIHDVIIVDGDVLVPSLKRVYDNKGFNSRARVNIGNINIRIDDSLAYADSANNTAAAILITASGTNWVWGANLYNITVSGHFLAAVHVKSNGTSWLHDIHITKMINDRTINRLLVDSDDEEIKSTGVAVYDKDGAMQTDNYVASFWGYTPQRLVKMYTGIVVLDNVFPWDWHLTVDANGNKVDGEDRTSDYIYEGYGGILHVNSNYHIDGVKNGLYNLKYSLIKGSSRFREVSTIKSNRVITESLNDEKENLLIERIVNNTGNNASDWPGFLRICSLGFRLPFGVTLNNTISYPRFVEIGYFKYNASSTFELLLSVNNSKMHISGNISTTTFNVVNEDKFADGFCNTLRWAYFREGEKVRFGFILRDKTLSLSAYEFAIENALSFYLNINSYDLNSVNITVLDFNKPKLATVRPILPAIGECIFDVSLGKPIWAKTNATRGRLTITANTINNAVGTIDVVINGVSYTLSIDKVCETTNELAKVLARELQKAGFAIYITSNNYTIIQIDEVIADHNVINNNIDAQITTGVNSGFKPASWVDATGTVV